MDAMIIKETNNGLERYTIQDNMLLNREIELVGEINTKSVSKLISQLLHLDQESKEDIVMYINSSGGSVNAGLALYDVMQAVESNIKTVCIGMAGSMAAILFIAGDKREILNHSEIMIHDPLISPISGSALSIKTRSERLMQLRDITSEIIAKHSNKTIDEIYTYTAINTYFTAEEAIVAGFADTILTKFNNKKGVI